MIVTTLDDDIDTAKIHILWLATGFSRTLVEIVEHFQNIFLL